MSNEIDASNGAMSYADEHGVDLSRVSGTGKDGRILKGDVVAYVEARDSQPEEMEIKEPIFEPEEAVETAVVEETLTVELDGETVEAWTVETEGELTPEGDIIVDDLSSTTITRTDGTGHSSSVVIELVESEPITVDLEGETAVWIKLVGAKSFVLFGRMMGRNQVRETTPRRYHILKRDNPGLFAVRDPETGQYVVEG